MPDKSFYSDRTLGPGVVIKDFIPEATARGLFSLIDSRITANWLAREFPERCQDGAGVAGTDLYALGVSLEALVPGVSLPLSALPFPQSTELVFDVIEYIAHRIAAPVELRYHSFFSHHELSFEPEQGFDRFRSDINLLLRRGLVMYELRDNRQIHRNGTPEVQSVLALLDPATGDARLDELLEQARALYKSPKVSERSMALERLWDAFERLKTIEIPGGNKKESVQALLSNLSPEWRPIIEDDMIALTKIGNSYEIRHFETWAKPLPKGTSLDYLFVRLGALIFELLSTSKRLRPP